MKVVIIMPTLSLGGAERVAVSLANWLIKKDVDVHFLNMSEDTKNYNFDPKINVYHKNYDSSNANKFKKLKLKLNYILGTLDKIKPDVIFEMLYYPVPYLTLYKLKNKKVVIIGSERNNPKMRNKKLIDKFFAWFSPMICDGYIFQTEKVKQLFSRSIQNKSTVIPNAIELKDIKQSNKKDKTIVNVGRLNYQKGQDILIKAFKAVTKKYPAYKLVIYGEGPERTNLENLINDLNLKNNVILAGNEKNVLNKINSAKMFVLSSRYEGMPNALLEAMALGLPCISTDCVAGPSEIIENNKNGILVPVDDVSELSKKILYLIENEEVSNQIGKSAKNVLITNSQENIFNSYFKFFLKKYYEKKLKLSFKLKLFFKFEGVGLTKLLSDKAHLKILYKLRIGRKLNLKNPKTFNEKLQWLKLNDRNPEYQKMVDKYEVKKYVSNVIGEKYIIPTIGVWEKFDDIDFSKLPNQFVIKTTHDSGGLYICKDKRNINLKLIETKINNSLNTNYYYHGREWHYKNIKPRIIIEEYMEDNNTDDLIDYKVMCFNGIPKMTFTCSDRYSDCLKVTFFDLDWKKMPFERHYPSSSENVKKPNNYKEMLELSKKLSKDIPFVRVDWYEINGNLYFGELTFFPGNGLEEFSPEIWDRKLGDMLKLPLERNSDKDE